MSHNRGPWAVAFFVVAVIFGPQAGGRSASVRQADGGRHVTPPAIQRLAAPEKPVPTPESLTPPSMLQDTKTIPYTVKRGESVESIAWRMLPETAYVTQTDLVLAIRAANGLKNRRLQPAQVIHIPGVPIRPFQDKPELAPKNFDARAIYLTGWTAGSLYGLKLIKQWKDVGGNAVVFDIKDFDGQVRVPYNHPYASDRWVTIRNLPKFIHWLHALHMHAIARIALFRDEYLAQTYPQFDVRSRKTGKPWLENGHLDWVDPSLPAVQQYNLDLARMVAKAGADEIQFDYVRFPAEGDQPDAIFAFQKSHPNMPRTQVISDFVTRAYGSLHPMNVRVSLDVFGVMAWARKADLDHTGQDIPELARHCDILSPMIYPSHFFHFDGYTDPGDAPEHFISESMKRFEESTKGSGVVIRPWLQAFAWRTKSYSVNYVLTEVQVAKQDGGIGFLFWNADNRYPKPLEAMTQIRTISGRTPTRPAAQKAVSAGGG
jgi:hypothetical protein